MSAKMVLELGDVEIHSFAEAHFTGGVDENIDIDTGEEAPQTALMRHVRPGSDHRAQGQRPRVVIKPSRQGEDLGPTLGKPSSDRLTDPRRSSGHDRCLA
jgi:hypothetical protein